MKRSVLSVMVGILCVGLLSGCTNTGSGKAVDSLVDTRVEVVKAQNDLHDTLTALDGLEKATGNDIKPAYENFKKALAATEAQKKRAEKRTADMREKSADYQKQWAEETSKINNPDLKMSAEQRAAHVSDKYGQIRELALECRKNYADLNSNLMDINQYLGADLNAAAIEKAKPTIASAKKYGDSLTSNLSELVAEMNELTAEMNPSGKVPEK